MARILIVDDDEGVRAVLSFVLERQGHEVIIATNGREALRLFGEKQPELVMTDLVMPDKEGLETILELRRKHPRVPIIAMSGGGRANGADYLKMAKAMGANRTLTKPLSMDQLPGIIDSLLHPPPASETPQPPPPSPG